MAQKETGMGRNIPGHRLDKFRQSPSLFLAYCGIRRALKKAALLEMIGKGLVIFIAPTGYRQSDYCTAARYLFEGIPEFRKRSKFPLLAPFFRQDSIRHQRPETLPGGMHHELCDLDFAIPWRLHVCIQRLGQARTG